MSEEAYSEFETNCEYVDPPAPDISNDPVVGAESELEVKTAVASLATGKFGSIMIQADPSDCVDKVPLVQTLNFFESWAG
jgi:hypothetical protein